MFETILTKLSIVAIVFILMIAVSGKRLLKYKVLLASFFILYFADNFIIIISNLYPALQVIPNHIWEGFLICSWSGKLYSIIFTLILAYLLRKLLTYQEVGLKLRQNIGSVLPSMIVILLLATWAAIIGFNSPIGRMDVNALAYLAIMPGLNEELVYRGVLLGILDKIMPRRINLLGGWIGWGVILTSILFSLLHGFQFEHGLSLHINAIALINSFISGFIFAWLKEHTGSLVLPVIAHGLVDFLFFLPRMI